MAGLMTSSYARHRRRRRLGWLLAPLAIWGRAGQKRRAQACLFCRRDPHLDYHMARNPKNDDSDVYWQKWFAQHGPTPPISIYPDKDRTVLMMSHRVGMQIGGRDVLTRISDIETS